MKQGYVYILTNPSMPGLVKIGRSKNGGRKRAADLYQTGVPSPFVVEFEVLVNDANEVEAEAHLRLRDNRLATGREFFKVDVSEAIEAILAICANDIDCEVVSIDEFIDPSDVWCTLSKIYENPGMHDYLDFYQSLYRVDPEHIKLAIEKHREIRASRYKNKLKVTANG